MLLASNMDTSRPPFLHIYRLPGGSPLLDEFRAPSLPSSVGSSSSSFFVDGNHSRLVINKDDYGDILSYSDLNLHKLSLVYQIIHGFF